MTGFRAFYSDSLGQLMIVRPGIDTVTDLTSWKAWLAAQAQNNRPLQAVWELLTQVSVQLTPPQPLTTLRGENAVWTDIGTTTLTYRADPTLAAETLTAAILSLGSNI